MLAAVSSGGCTRLPTSTASPRGDVTLSIGVPEGSVVSAASGAREQASMLALEGLTQLDVDGRVLPRVAESWRWEKDGLRLRVFLRRNVRFHDGTLLTSAVTVDVLRSVVARAGNRALYPSLNDITSITADGDLQVVIDLSGHSAFLPEDLSVALELGENRVGTGPYRVVKRDGAELILDRFDQYYLGRPSISRVSIRPFDALRTTWTSLLRGELDMVTDLPPDSVEFIENDQIQAISFPRWYQFMLAFNFQNAHVTPGIVRALNLAVNRDTLIKKALKGYGSPASGPLWPKHWAYDNTIQGYGFDPAAATALFEAAGLRKGAAGAGNGFPGARLRFTCLIPSQFSVLERLGLELQRQLYDVGVDMQFEAVPIGEYLSRIGQGKFDAVLVDMISGPTIGRPYIFWRSAKTSKGGYNVFGYEDPEAERLFETLRTSMSEAAVRSATSRLQRVLLDDPPAVFLAWSERARVVRREFHVVQDPGRDPISSLWRWTANTGELHTASVQ